MKICTTFIVVFALSIAAIPAEKVFAERQKSVGALECCNCRKIKKKQRSARASSSALSAAVLDFDGDGISEIVQSFEDADETNFKFKRSSDSEVVKLTLEKGLPAPADYDGDGRWDAAVVNRESNGLVWRIEASGPEGKVRKNFGSTNSTIISGCRLLSADKYSLAYVDGRKLFATELGSEFQKNIVFTLFMNSEVIGCGDMTGDGIDELIFRSRSSNTPQFSDDISTAGCVNDIVVYRNLPTFHGAFVVQREGTDAPVVAVPRSKNSLTSLEVYGLFGKFRIFGSTAARNAVFSTGRFKDSNGNDGPGIIWLDPGTNSIEQKLFSAPRKTNKVGTADKDSILVKAQNIYK